MDLSSLIHHLAASTVGALYRRAIELHISIPKPHRPLHTRDTLNQQQLAEIGRLCASYLDQCIQLFVSSKCGPSLAAAAPLVTPQLQLTQHHIDTLNAILEAIHVLFSTANDALEYAKYIEDLVSTSHSKELSQKDVDSKLPVDNGPSSIVNLCQSTELFSLLSSSLPCIIQLLDWQLKQSQSDAAVAVGCPSQIANLIQSVLSLMCRTTALATAERMSSTAPIASDYMDALSRQFSGDSLRQMLRLLIDTQQFTTTVERVASGSEASTGDSILQTAAPSSDLQLEVPFSYSSLASTVVLDPSVAVAGSNGQLCNVLVPFARHVLTGLFLRFAKDGVTTHEVRCVSKIQLDETAFSEFYRLSCPTVTSTGSSPSPSADTPSNNSNSLGSGPANPLIPIQSSTSGSSTARTAASNRLHLQLPLSVSITNATPTAPSPTTTPSPTVDHNNEETVQLALPPNRSAALDAAAASFHPLPVASSASPPAARMLSLPLAPSFYRSHTAQTPQVLGSIHPSHVSNPMPRSVQLSNLSYSLAQLQASAEFRRAVAAAQSASSANIFDLPRVNPSNSHSASSSSSSSSDMTIDLNGWLRWHLDGFVDHPRAKLEQLNRLDRSWAMIKRNDFTQKNRWTTYQVQLEAAYDILLQQVFPPVLSNNPHSLESAGAVKRSQDDLDLSRSGSSSIPSSTSLISSPSLVESNLNISEVIPRLLESEANWSHHRDHLQHAQFLDKFIHQPTRFTSVNQQKAAIQSTSEQTPELHPATNVVPQSFPMLAAPAPSFSIQLSSLSPTDDLKDEGDRKQSLTQNVTWKEQESLEAAAKAISSATSQSFDVRVIAQSLMPPLPFSQASLQAPYDLCTSPITPLTFPPEENKKLLANLETGASVWNSTVSNQLEQPKPSVKSTLPSPSTEFPDGELEEPSRCFHSLFIRCLSEMGGGSAKKRIENWNAAVRAEKAYAAVCIKHNGLAETVLEFSSSVAAIELIRLARLSVNPKTGLPSLRVLAHPSCPQWMRAIVSSTFQEVRNPLLNIMRGIEEEEEQIEARQQQGEYKNDAEAGSDATPSLKQMQSNLRRLKRAADSMVNRVFANSRFLVRDLDQTQTITTALEGSSKGHVDSKHLRVATDELSGRLDKLKAKFASASSQYDGLDSSDQSLESDDDGDSNEIPEQRSVGGSLFKLSDDSLSRSTVPTRYRYVSSSGSNSTAASSPPSPAHSGVRLGVEKATFPAQLQSSTLFCFHHPNAATSRGHAASISGISQQPGFRVSASSASLQSAADQSVPEGSTSTGDRSGIAPPPIQRQVSDIARRRRHSVLTISPYAPLKPNVPTSEASLEVLNESPENEAEDIAQVSRATSITNYLAEDVNKHQDVRTDATAHSSLWSSTSCRVEKSPYDSKWIMKLVGVGSETTLQSHAPSLRSLIEPSIARVQSVCLLRLKLVSWLNFCFSGNFSGAVVERALPIVVRMLRQYPLHHDRHLLHYGNLILKGKHTKHVLLHFYKHVVTCINLQLAGRSYSAAIATPQAEIVTPSSVISYEDASWSHIRTCLDLLNLDFLPEDTESLVGSGVFAALFRTMLQIDQDIASALQHRPTSQLLTSLPVGHLSSSIQFASAYHLKFVCWQRLQSLTQFVLKQQRSTNVNSVLLSSVARQFVDFLLRHLELLSLSPVRSPLKQENGNLRYAMEAAQLLLRFVPFKALMDQTQLHKLISYCSFVPPAIQSIVTQLLTYELLRISPSELPPPEILPGMAPHKAGPQAPFSTSSAWEVMENLFQRVGGRLISCTVLPSLLQSGAGSGVSGHSVGPITKPNELHYGSAYQTWQSYPYLVSTSESDISVIEETLVSIRTMAANREWTSVTLKYISEHLAQLPALLKQLTGMHSAPVTQLSQLSSTFEGCFGSLAALGSHPFSLRKGACVEVSIHGRNTIRGIVIAIDSHVCKALVRFNSSQPHFQRKPYQFAQSSDLQQQQSHSHSKSQQQPIADVRPFQLEEEFSFDQLRAVPTVHAVDVSDLFRSVDVSCTLRTCLEWCQSLVLEPTGPTLLQVFAVQLSQQLMELLRSQLSVASAQSRRLKASTVAASIKPIIANAFEIHPYAYQSSPGASPVSPQLSVEATPYVFNALSPSPPTPLQFSPSPEPSNPKHALALSEPLLYTSMNYTTDSTPPKRTTEEATACSQSSSAKLETSLLIPLLERICSAMPQSFISTSLFELEKYAGVYSRRIGTILREEKRYAQLWRDSLVPDRSGLLSTQLDEDNEWELIPDRVSIIRFDSLPSDSDDGSRPDAPNENSPSTSVVPHNVRLNRGCFIRALRYFFQSNPNITSRKNNQSRHVLLPRLMIFPLMAKQSTAMALSNESISQGIGVVIVQLPTTVSTRKSYDESKQQTQHMDRAIDSAMPRLIQLSELGLSDDMLQRVFPHLFVEASDATDTELEAEALELTIGRGCDPSYWSDERWEAALNACQPLTSSDVSVTPSANDVTVCIRRVIIGPTGQAGVITGVTPAVSKVNSPAVPPRTLQEPSSISLMNRLTAAVTEPLASNSPLLSAMPSSLGASMVSPPVPSSSVGGSTSQVSSDPFEQIPHLQAKFIRITTSQERGSLIQHIQRLAAQQPRDPRQARLYDFVDAKDSYGDWYLAQVIGWRNGTNRESGASVVTDLFVHFVGWDDMYRELIPMTSVAQYSPDTSVQLPARPSDRVRRASLFEDTRLRFENDRFIRKVKIYGNAVPHAIKVEREQNLLLLARDHAKQIASVTLSDAYSFPVTSFPTGNGGSSTSAGALDTGSLSKLDGKTLAIGSHVFITAAVVELLSLQLGHGLLEIASEYRVGDRLMVLDTVNKLCEAEVVACRMPDLAAGGNTSGLNQRKSATSNVNAPQVNEIFIHYIGWPSKWDEWLSVSSTRIQSKRGGAGFTSTRQSPSSDVEQQLSSSSWAGEKGHAAQLISLVGQVAVISKLAQPSSVSEANVKSLSNSPNSTMDALAQILVVDPRYGSMICFWTQLALLKRLDQVDIVHHHLPGIVRLTEQQLIAECYNIERQRLSVQLSSVMQAVGQVNEQYLATKSNANEHVQLVDTSSFKPSVDPASFHTFLASCMSCMYVAPGFFPRAPSGILDSNSSPHNIAETTWVIHPSHRCRLSEKELEAVDTEARKRHIFIAETEKKEAESKTSEQPSSQMTSDAAATVVTNANSSPTDSHIPSSIEPPPTDAMVFTDWLSERQYRSLTHDQLHKLALITSMCQRIVHSDSYHAAMPSQVVTLLHHECDHLHDGLQRELLQLSKGIGEPSLRSALSSGIQTIRPGESRELSVSDPQVSALVVSWTRSSQPNFEVQFMATAATVHDTSVAQTSQRDIVSGSPPPSDFTLIDAEINWPTVASPSQVFQSNSNKNKSKLIPLVQLKRVPLLRSGATPLILPNPCVVVAGMPLDATKKNDLDDVEAADDDFSIVVTPYSSKSIQMFLVFVQVIVHLQRDVRAQMHDSKPIDQGMIALLVQVARNSIDSLVTFQSMCPWPAAVFKGAIFESIAHLFIEITHIGRACIRMASEDAHKSKQILATIMELQSWAWIHPFVLEAKERYASEKENWPLFSTYLQRLFEMLITAIDLERVLEDAKFIGSVETITSGSVPKVVIPHGELHNLEGTVEFYPNSISSNSRDTSPSSVYHTPPSEPNDIELIDRGQPHSSTLASDRSAEGVIEVAGRQLPIVLELEALILRNKNVFLRVSPLTPPHLRCICRECQIWRGEAAGMETVLMLIDSASSVWPLLLGGPLTLLPLHLRARLFDELLNSTATPERWLPEFGFLTNTERDLNKDVANGTSSPAASTTQTEETDSIWQQLVKNLRVTPLAHLRSKLGDVVWKSRFKGIANRGAEGLPGPFRQSLTEVCDNLRAAATSTDAEDNKHAVLCQTPNFHFDTGLDRNKLLLRPSCGLAESFAFGQLLGIAIRSQGVLDVDLASVVWKAIEQEELTMMDLASVDYSAYKQLQFINFDTSEALNQEEFDEQYAELTWTTTLSDGRVVELIAGGAKRSVRFSQRFLYARYAMRQRLHESQLQLNNIRAGLASVVPLRSLNWLSWKELELRACGNAVLDLALLAHHTVYAPKKFDIQSQIVQWFWQALRQLTEEEKAKFMQFAWARSRLPPPTGGNQTSWRMKVNILEAAGPNDLPTAETCFFNLNIPNYHDYETLYAKLSLAIYHCSSINS